MAIIKFKDENGNFIEIAKKSDLNQKENNSNKVTELSSESTDEQYPSAKCVYNLLGNIESILDDIRGVTE